MDWVYTNDGLFIGFAGMIQWWRLQLLMPRKGRIEFAGAFYHLLDRGDRREDIVRDETDRRKATGS